MRWALLVLVAGCYSDDAVTCGPLRCPQGRVCSPAADACVTQTQLDACTSKIDGDGCSVPGMPEGVCHQSVCIAAGCGNGVVEVGEACDDGNRVSLDGCSLDCASREQCGDGIVDPALGELCDCGSPGAVASTCTSANSNDPGAECRADCSLASCGDGILDPQELCDDGNTRYYDGCRGDCQGRFAKMQTPTALGLNSVFALSPTDAVAVGNTGTLLHFDGVSWKDESALIVTDDLLSIWAFSPSDIYVGGRNSVFLHYNGTSWLYGTVAPLSGDVKDLWGVSGNEMWGVINTDLAHRTSTGWGGGLSDPTCGDSGAAVWGRTATDFYVANGTAVCHSDGVNASIVGLSPYFAVTGSATVAYAVAGGASAYLINRMVGATSTGSDIVPGVISTMTMADDTHLLAVGNAGTILGYDGTTWTNFISPTEQTLTRVSATSETNVFIVGNNGVILH